MPIFTDQTGRIVSIPRNPHRIISLVPSQTELLADLGLDEEVVGITKFCIHPMEWYKIKTRVGGTKNLKMDTIHQLAPDLVIANKEENTKSQIEELEKHYPVWVSDVNDLDSAFEMIAQIGQITNRVNPAQDIISRIKKVFTSADRLRTSTAKPATAYLIWKDPYLTVGGDTFIHSMLEWAGFENIFKTKTRYPEITIEDIRDANCELLLLSSEPYPFKEKHAAQLGQSLPGTKIMLVDGEMFSWYGSRLQYAPGYFAALRK